MADSLFIFILVLSIASLALGLMLWSNGWRHIATASRAIRRNWPSLSWWAKFGLVIAVILVFCLGICAFTMWFIVRIVKALSVGGYRNMDLYFPRRR